MAPFLLSIPEQQQVELPTPVPMSKRLMKPVIPAVPRVFERRRVTGNVRTPNSGCVIGEQDEHTGSTLSSSADDTPVISADEHTPKSPSERATFGSSASHYVTESAAITKNQDETSSTSTFYQGSGMQGNLFQLPPAFYPMPAHSNRAIYPINSFEIEAFMNQPQPRLFSPYKHDPNIVFGGELDSSSSSPRSVPSAGSTTYTQPTPLSDATSCRSQSIYQGYGHLPNVYEHYASSKLVFNPPEDHYSQPPQISPTTSDYGIAAPQAHLDAQLPAGQVFPQLSITDTAASDPLKAYLLEQFNNPEFADCSLILEIGGQATTFMLHSVVIAQIPTLKALLQSSKVLDSEGRKTLVLEKTDPHLTLPVVTSALQTCYGEAPPQDSQIINELESALAYLATGRLFQLPLYEDIGTTGVLKFLTLENLVKVMTYALSDAANVETDAAAIQETGLSYPSRRLFEGLLDFMVTNFPNPFVLDLCAPNSTALGGHPPVPLAEPQQQQQRPKPELMSIRFGEFPSASHSIPSVESTALSSILLSVPFSVLQQIIQALGQSATQDIAGPIIKERERRRLKALETGIKLTTQEGYSPATDDLERHSWGEQVVATHSGNTTTR